MAKVWGRDASHAKVDDSAQNFSDAGFIADHAAEYVFLDCQVNRIFEGSTELNRLIIASSFLNRRSGTDELDLTQGERVRRSQRPALAGRPRDQEPHALPIPACQTRREVQD